MNEKLSPVLTDAVYSLICENPGILKYDLYHKINECPYITITYAMLDDVIFVLRQKRGIFVVRGYGYYRDENTFYSYSCGAMPGKIIRKRNKHV